MTTNGAERQRAATFAQHWQFEILVPIRFNDDDPQAPGQPVPREVFNALERQFLTRFGGFSRNPEDQPGVEGMWQSAVTGRSYTDTHRSFRVVTNCLAEHEAYFLALHAELCERLRQEDMFMTRQEIKLATQRRG